MTIHVLDADTPSAPLLQTAAGSMINLLKKLLVEGFGDYPGLGWTVEFEDVANNKCVFKQPLGSNQMLLRVEESSLYHAVVRGYESMTDIDTGVGAFPTVSQLAEPRFFKTTRTTTTYDRYWRFIADDTAYGFFLQVSTDSNYPTTRVSSQMQVYYFGDFISFVSGDAYNTVLITGNASLYGYSAIAYNLSSKPASGAAVPEIALAKDFSQVGSATKGYPVGFNDNNYSLGNIAYPNPVDNKFWLTGAKLGEESAANGKLLRGRLPGLYFSMTTQPPWVDGDTVRNHNDTKTFMGLLYGYSQTRMIWVQTAGVWE